MCECVNETAQREVDHNVRRMGSGMQVVPITVNLAALIYVTALHVV